MLGENIKTLRTQKGYSQEALAEKLHVVRQTVSKWEKGLSVPDAEMLTRLADALEVSVSELLGTPLPPENDINEVAVQLARINDQLTIRNRRWRRFWLGVLFVFLAFVLFTVLGVALFGVNTSSSTEGPMIETEWSEDEAVEAEGADS